jgi:DHA1 family tetracycline resistance protein-like MFS transporter
VQATIVLFAVFAATVGNASVTATLGLYGRGVGLSEIEVGAIFASSALLFFLTSSYWGRLSDRAGRARIMAVGLGATAASLGLFAGLYGIGGTFFALLLARVLYGLFAGSIQPAATAWMADHTPAGRRASGVALVGAAVGIASMAGPLLAASLVGFGLTVPVIVGAAVTATAAATTFLGLHETPSASAAMTAGTAVEGLRPYLLVGFAMVLGFGGLQATMAFYAQDCFGLATAEAVRQASFASASFSATSFVVQAFLIRHLSWPPCRLLMIGLVICLLGIAVTLAASAAAGLIVGYAILGGGYGLAQSGLTAAVSVLAGRQRQGLVAGRLQAAMAAAWIVGPLAGTALYPLAIASPLLLAAVGLALALLATSQIRR